MTPFLTNVVTAGIDQQRRDYFAGESENQGAIIDVLSFVLTRFDTVRNEKNAKIQELVTEIKHWDHLNDGAIKYAYPLSRAAEGVVTKAIIKRIK